MCVSLYVIKFLLKSGHSGSPTPQTWIFLIAEDYSCLVTFQAIFAVCSLCGDCRSHSAPVCSQSYLDKRGLPQSLPVHLSQAPWMPEGSPQDSVIKSPPASAGDAGSLVSSPREGNSNHPSTLASETSTCRRAWQTTVHGHKESGMTWVTKQQ